MQAMADFKKKLKTGQLVLCVSLLQARTADAPLISAAAGADCVYVDIEHGTTSLESAALLCASALGGGIAPLVRVPAGALDLASRMLDAGAAGVILPHVDTAAQARQAIEHFRFAPHGHRSFGGMGMPTLYRSMPLDDMLSQLNRNTTVIAMIETPEGVENADAIAAEDGVDVLLVGTNDLCIELEIPGRLRDPKIRSAIEKVNSACQRHGKVLGIGGVRNDYNHFEEVMGLGAGFLIIGSDAGYLALGIGNDVRMLRSLSETVQGKTKNVEETQ